jgi:hypothetical protein
METLLFMAVLFYLIYKSGLLDIPLVILSCYICWELMTWSFSKLLSLLFG